MRRRTFLTVAVLSTIGVPARAATRGGTLVFGRQTDCIYLDPVHTAQNADIWVSLNLYDTLTQPTDDGKNVVSGPGIVLAGQSGRQGDDLQAAAQPEVCRRLAADGRGCEVVAANARPTRQPGVNSSSSWRRSPASIHRVMTP